MSPPVLAIRQRAFAKTGDHNAPARAHGRPYEIATQFNGLGIFPCECPRTFGGSCGREGPNSHVSQSSPSLQGRLGRIAYGRVGPNPRVSNIHVGPNPRASNIHTCPHVSKIYTRRAISYGRVGPNARVSEIQNGPQAGTALRQKLRALRFRLSKCTNNSGVRSSVTAVAKVRPPMIDRAMGM